MKDAAEEVRCLKRSPPGRSFREPEALGATAPIRVPAGSLLCQKSKKIIRVIIRVMPGVDAGRGGVYICLEPEPKMEIPGYFKPVTINLAPGEGGSSSGPACGTSEVRQLTHGSKSYSVRTTEISTTFGR